MSILSGTLGAVLGADAQRDALDSQQALAGQSIQNSQNMFAVQRADAQRVYDQQRADSAPYMQYGLDALSKIQNYGLPDAEAPSYDEVVTDQLGNYKSSDQFNAQNTLANAALQRQLQARGLNYSQTGANALGEQTQKLIASDYGNYKTDLANRYGGLTSDYKNAIAANQLGYDRLSNALNVGRNMASSVGGYGSAMGGQLANAGNSYTNASNAGLNNLFDAIGQQGQLAGQMYSGLGSAMGQTGATVAKLGQSAGWWGGSGGAAASTGAAAGNSMLGSTPWGGSDMLGSMFSGSYGG